MEQSMLICIQNHYKRDVSKYAERIKNLGHDVKVFTDNTDYYQKRNHNRYRGLNLNFLNMLDYDTKHEWKLIIHDDLIFEDDAFKKIQYILRFAPKFMMSFYSCRNKIYRDAWEKRHHILASYMQYWPPCMAYHKSMQKDLIEYFDKKADIGLISEDVVVWKYCSDNDKLVYALTHGLVQHDLEQKSVVGNSPSIGKNRRDSEHYNPDFNPNIVDWKKEFENPSIFKKKYTDNKGIKDEA